MGRKEQVLCRSTRSQRTLSKAPRAPGVSTNNGKGRPFLARGASHQGGAGQVFVRLPPMCPKIDWRRLQVQLTVHSRPFCRPLPPKWMTKFIGELSSRLVPRPLPLLFRRLELAVGYNQAFLSRLHHRDRRKGYHLFRNSPHLGQSCSLNCVPPLASLCHFIHGKSK